MPTTKHKKFKQSQLSLLSLFFEETLFHQPQHHQKSDQTFLDTQNHTIYNTRTWWKYVEMPHTKDTNMDLDLLPIPPLLGKKHLRIIFQVLVLFVTGIQGVKVTSIWVINPGHEWKKLVNMALLRQGWLCDGVPLHSQKTNSSHLVVGRAPKGNSSSNPSVSGANR